MREQSLVDGQLAPETPQPGHGVATEMAKTHVVLTPQLAIRRYGEQQMGAGSHGRDKGSQQANVVVDMLQHVVQHDQVSRSHGAGDTFGGKSSHELNLWKATRSPVNRIDRGIDPQAVVRIGKGTDIPSRSAADIDYGSAWRRGHQLFYQATKDLPPGDKPPMLVLNLGVQLELFCVHGGSLPVSTVG